MHSLTRQTLRCTKQKLTVLQGEIHKSIINAGDFKICIAFIDPTVKKLVREQLPLTTQLSLIWGLYVNTVSTITENIFLSFSHELFFLQKLVT